MSNSWDARRRLRSDDPKGRDIDSDLRMRGDSTGGGALGRRLLPVRFFWARLTIAAAAVATVAASAAAAAAHTNSDARTSAAAGVANTGERIAGQVPEAAADVGRIQCEGLIVMVAIACAW